MRRTSASKKIDDEGVGEPNQNICSARKKACLSWADIMVLRQQQQQQQHQQRDEEVHANGAVNLTAGEAAAAAHRQVRCNPRPSSSQQRAPAMILQDHGRTATAIVDDKAAAAMDDALPTTEAIVAAAAKVSNSRGRDGHRHPHAGASRAKRKNASEDMNFDLLHETNPGVRRRDNRNCDPLDAIHTFDSFVEHVYQMTMRNEQAWLQQQQQQQQLYAAYTYNCV
mmetsp:Transcript_19618/g.30171  ORF Transcript_19618/g.30171 Transcript_19618/m.30171 type:complete len:225 (-) Transcript_19618:97-771(-)